jgi:hypothetical protein
VKIASRRLLVPTLVFLCSILPGVSQNNQHVKGKTTSPAKNFNSEPKKITGGLVTQIMNVGRAKDKTRVTFSFTIRNVTSDGKTAYLAVIGSPLAVDNQGGQYYNATSAGIARCNNDPRNCLNPQSGLPINGFTRINPNQTVPVTITLYGNASEGSVISLSLDVMYRLVSNPEDDENHSIDSRYRQFQISGIGFPSVEIE